MKKLFIITGEYSGDLHASRIVSRLLNAQPSLSIEAIGGVNLQKTGIKLFSSHAKMSAAGINLKIIFDHFLLGKNLVKYLTADYMPDVLLLIDYGGFNLNIAKVLKKKMPNLKIIYYIPPQIWASRKWRLNSMKKYIDKVLTIFPFENEMYESKNIPVQFVGHPLIEELPSKTDKIEFYKKNHLDLNKKTVALFPGSRTFEIKMLMPTILKSVEKLIQNHKDLQFILCQSPNIKDELLAKYNIPPLIKILKNENYALLSTSDVLLLASGTVALEAAIYQTPMVVIYRAPWLLYSVYLLVRCIKNVSLPNIILQKNIIPELIQTKCKPTIIEKNISELLYDENKRAFMCENLKNLKSLLSEKNAAEEASKILLTQLSQKK